LSGNRNFEARIHRPYEPRSSPVRRWSSPSRSPARSISI